MASTATAPSSPPPSTADEIIERIHAVMHQVRSLQYRSTGGDHEVTHLESKLLGFFSHHPGATLSDLAQHSGRDKSQLARLVKGLRERGLLAAEPDAADRRNVRLALSPEGQAVQQALRRQARRLNRSAVEGIGEEKQRELLALLGRVQANLDGLG